MSPHKTLRIERALEETNKHGLRMKAPKTARGIRTIKIDDELLSLLLTEREQSPAYFGRRPRRQRS